MVTVLAHTGQGGMAAMAYLWAGLKRRKQTLVP